MIKLSSKLYIRKLLSKIIVSGDIKDIINKDYILDELKSILIKNPLNNETAGKWFLTTLYNYLSKGDYSDLEEIDNSDARGIELMGIDDVDMLDEGTHPKIVEKVENGDIVYIVYLKDTFEDRLGDLIDYLNLQDANYFRQFHKVSVPDAFRKLSIYEDVIDRATGVKFIINAKDLPNGKWFKILTEKSLLREGRMMQNCLKTDVYWDDVKKGITEIYSLRDKDGSHVNIEITNNILKQIKGKQNKPAIEKYHSAIKDFVINIDEYLGEKIVLKNNRDIIDYDMLIIGDKVYHKDGLSNKIKGDLDLSRTVVTSLPNNLIIDGDIYVGNFESLNVIINNDYVYNNLYLDNSKVQILNNKIVINGDLDFNRCHMMTLPDNLVINGDLDFSSSSIRILPNNLRVNGDLILKDSLIKTLLDNLYVSGNLDLRNTSVELLPYPLHVGGSLDLKDSFVRLLSDNLQISGDLNLENTNITSLPNNLQVGDNLNISYTNIKSLPNDLRVGGDLNIEYCKKLTSLPDSISISGMIYSYKNELINIPEKLKNKIIIKK